MSAKRKADDMTAPAAAAASAPSPATNENDTSREPSLVSKNQHAEMIDACSSGRLDEVTSLLDAAENDDDDAKPRPSAEDCGDDGSARLSPRHLLAARQDPSTGLSPLMAAARNGHVDVCRVLLDAGAPWNAVDRWGRCAGDYATEAQKWDVVNLLVEAGTKAEVSPVSVCYVFGVLFGLQCFDALCMSSREVNHAFIPVG